MHIHPNQIGLSIGYALCYNPNPTLRGSKSSCNTLNRFEQSKLKVVFSIFHLNYLNRYIKKCWKVIFCLTGQDKNTSSIAHDLDPF